MNTGSIQRSGGYGAPNYGSNPGAGVTTAASQPYPAGGGYGGGTNATVQSHTLPPPPSRATARRTAAPASATPSARRNLPDPRGAPDDAAGTGAAHHRAVVAADRHGFCVFGACLDRTAASVTVRSGDTLLGIARETGVSVDAIKQANGLSDDNIRLGQTLVVPGAQVDAA